MKNRQIKKAAALKYNKELDRAPRVVAKGRGAVAEKIMEIAGRHQIPVVADPNLAQMLDAMDLETEIPQEMYQAVAEVLVFVYRLNRH